MIGSETLLVSRLMSAFSSFSPRHSSYSSSTPLVASSSNYKQYHVIEAGSLLLARHGVHLTGDLDAYKKEMLENIRSSEFKTNTLPIKMEYLKYEALAFYERHF